MKKILCLSTANYYPFPTRKQNIMNRLTDCKVVYVDPAVSYIAPLKDPECRKEIRRYKEGPVQALPHVRVYAQPPVKPFYNKYRAINRSNQRAFAKYLADICRKEKMGKDFWIWCYSPTSCDVIAPLAKRLGMDPDILWGRTVYDCVDRHSAYPGHIDPAVVDKMEEDLARHAAYVFSTAEGLHKRLKQFNPNSYMIPNGANYELFNRVAKTEKTPSDGPVFGFVGMLQKCIDYSCIEALAKAYPNGKIRIAGKALPGVDLGALENYSNIEFLGLKPQEELPEIIKDFDVCLNLFADNELSANVSPLKFYEYLATGKPVISTPVPLQTLKYKDCIYICSGAKDIELAAEKALAEKPDSIQREKRLAEAKKCSWEERVKEIRAILSW